MRNRLEAGLFRLGLAALINGCATATPELQPQPDTPAPPPIVKIQPTSTATPTPPSELGKKLILPTPEPTPEPRPLSEFASLQAELMYPTTKSIDGLSFAEFMRQKGYEVFIARDIPPHNGIVVEEEAFVTRILPDENAQALPKKYSLKAGSKLTSIKYAVQVIKVGPTEENEPKQQQWIARLVYLPAEEGRPAIPMWIYNQHEYGYSDGRVKTFIKLVPQPPLPTTNA